MPRSGENNHKAKATDELIAQIRSEYRPYVNGYKNHAKKYGIPYTTIRDWVQYYTRRSAGG